MDGFETVILGNVSRAVERGVGGGGGGGGGGKETIYTPTKI